MWVAKKVKGDGLTRTRIIALAFLVVTAGIFVFTGTKNIPSHNDLRDAVADYNPDFNKGPDLAEFLKVATDPFLQTCMPFPPIKFAIIKGVSIKDEGLPSLRKEFLKAGARYIYGPYPPRVLNSAAYRNAQVYPPQLQQHENPTAYRLLADWELINTTRGVLLTDADMLNIKDSGLYAEGTQIDQTAVALKQEQTEFKAAVDAWNQQCVGQPVNTYCTNEYNRLQAWGKDLGNRIDAHNKQVEAWKASVKDLNSLVSIWISKVQDWETNIGYFISAVKAYFAGEVMCFLTETKHEPISIGNPPQVAFQTMCIYMCTTNLEWSFIWISPDRYYTCPGSVSDGQQPPMPIRRPSPDFNSEKPGFMFR